jgi:hypothetical protein
LITEIGDINRFPHIDDLASYVGLVPRVRESGETTHTGGITFRCNNFLRVLLVEASWQAIRQDPALMQYYHKHVINSKGHKVIIKIARSILGVVTPYPSQGFWKYRSTLLKCMSTFSENKFVIVFAVFKSRSHIFIS